MVASENSKIRRQHSQLQNMFWLKRIAITTLLAAMPTVTVEEARQNVTFHHVGCPSRKAVTHFTKLNQVPFSFGENLKLNSIRFKTYGSILRICHAN